LWIKITLEKQQRNKENKNNKLHSTANQTEKKKTQCQNSCEQDVSQNKIDAIQKVYKFQVTNN
jgi:hypothetical protein